MFSVCQIFKPSEKHLIQLYDCPQVLFETIPADHNKVVLFENSNDVLKGKIYYKEFRFDEIRNIAKSYVKTPYLLSLDADEVLLSQNAEIEHWIKSNKEAYTTFILNLDANYQYHVSEATRLFKTSLNWFGYAHERPVIKYDGDLQEVKELHRTDILIKHTGYSDNQINLEKAKRNVDLILQSNYALFDNYQRDKLLRDLIYEYKLKGEIK